MARPHLHYPLIEYPTLKTKRLKWSKFIQNMAMETIDKDYRENGYPTQELDELRVNIHNLEKENAKLKENTNMMSTLYKYLHNIRKKLNTSFIKRNIVIVVVAILTLCILYGVYSTRVDVNKDRHTYNISIYSGASQWIDKYKLDAVAHCEDTTTWVLWLWNKVNRWAICQVRGDETVVDIRCSPFYGRCFCNDTYCRAAYKRLRKK